MKSPGLSATGHFFLIFNFLLFTQSAYSQYSEFENETAIKADSSLTALTEQEVIESALKYSYKLQSLETNVEIFNYRYNSSGFIENPELRFRDFSTETYADEIQVGLRLNMPRPGELAEDEQQAKVRLWDKKVQQNRFRQGLVARVRSSFADVIKFDEQVVLAQKRLNFEDQRITIIESMVGLGSRSIVYFTKAKMWFAESKNDFARSQQRQGLARRRLERRSGIAVNATLKVSESVEINQTIEEILEIAYKNRPEMQLVYERIELAIRQNSFEKTKLIPWPTFVEYSHHNEKKSSKNWGEIIMGVNLPLFDWNIGNIQATNLAVKRKEIESDAVRESIEDEVRSAFIIYKDLTLDWANFNSNAQDLILNARQVIAQAAIHKTLMTDEVLEMELTILDTQKIITEKRCDLSHALTDLLFAIGIERYEQLTE